MKRKWLLLLLLGVLGAAVYGGIALATPLSGPVWAAKGSGTIRLDAAQGSGQRVIHVDDDAEPGGDGSGRSPFDNIADSLALAASLGGAVVVVEPGQYPVSSTLHIQSPVDLRGSNEMEVDD